MSLINRSPLAERPIFLAHYQTITYFIPKPRVGLIVFIYHLMENPFRSA